MRVIMWLFTKHGFLSVVCARQDDGKQGQPIDMARLMVRARVRGHLEALKKRWPDHLGLCDIRTFAGTDYAFRMFVDKPAWSRVLSELGLETDYDNFKSEVARHEGAAGSPYRACAPRRVVGDVPVQREIRASDPSPFDYGCAGAGRPVGPDLNAPPREDRGRLVPPAGQARFQRPPLTVGEPELAPIAVPRHERAGQVPERTPAHSHLVRPRQRVDASARRVLGCSRRTACLRRT